MKKLSIIRMVLSLVFVWGIQTASAQNFHVWNEATSLSADQPVGARLLKNDLKISVPGNAALDGAHVTFRKDSSGLLIADVLKGRDEVVITSQQVFSRPAPGGGTEIAIYLDAMGNAGLSLVLPASETAKISGTVTMVGQVYVASALVALRKIPG